MKKYLLIIILALSLFIAGCGDFYAGPVRFSVSPVPTPAVHKQPASLKLECRNFICRFGGK